MSARASGVGTTADEVAGSLVPYLLGVRLENVVFFEIRAFARDFWKLLLRRRYSLAWEHVVARHDVYDEIKLVFCAHHLHPSSDFEILLARSSVAFRKIAVVGQVRNVSEDDRVSANAISDAVLVIVEW